MFHLIKTVKASVKCLLREIAFSFFKCFSKFNCYHASIFFDDKKRINIIEKLQHFWSVNLPDILLFPIRLALPTRRIAFINVPSKVFKNPIYKTFICGSNIDSQIELSSLIGGFIHPKQQTSFSINYTCKISQFFPVIHEVIYV